MLVTLEGLEGVGKTTLGKLLAARHSATYIKSPPEEMNGPRGYISAKSSSRCSFYFYLSGLFAIQEEIEYGLRARGCVLVDRYLYSTIAYHDQGRSFAAPEFDAKGIRKPDLAIHVRCDPAAREARLKGRGFHIFDRAQSDEPAISRYFSDVCDVEFFNDDPVNDSVASLHNLMISRG
jgi:thymidylate kinase